MKLSLLALAGTSFALLNLSSTNSRLTEKNSPDRWVYYDITKPFNRTVFDVELEKRRQIGVCEAIVTASAFVVFIDIGKNWLVEYVNFPHPISPRHSFSLDR